MTKKEKSLVYILILEKKKKNDLFKILTIICLFIIVILVGILIKTINKKRKIRANELEENFEYISERKLI